MLPPILYFLQFFKFILKFCRQDLVNISSVLWSGIKRKIKCVNRNKMAYISPLATVTALLSSPKFSTFSVLKIENFQQPHGQTGQSARGH